MIGSWSRNHVIALLYTTVQSAVVVIGKYSFKMSGYDLKNSDEVAEYLKNLLIEYQFGCLNEKKPEVCHLLGDYMEAIKQDYKEAAAVYKKNCDVHNFGKSCTKYSGLRLLGNGCEKDIGDAYKYMTKGCDLNDAKGCTLAGSLAVTDQQLESPREAQVSHGIQMLKKGCHEGHEKSCFYLSGIFLKGIEGYVEKDLKQAYVLSLKCCELGNPYACSNVSLMHKRGEGVQQNLDMATAFRKRADELLKEVNKYKQQIKFQQNIDS